MIAIDATERIAGGEEQYYFALTLPRCGMYPEEGVDGPISTVGQSQHHIRHLSSDAPNRRRPGSIYSKLMIQRRSLLVPARHARTFMPPMQATDADCHVI